MLEDGGRVTGVVISDVTRKWELGGLEERWNAVTSGDLDGDGI